MALLPEIENAESFDRLLFRPGEWDEAIAEIRRAHGLTDAFSQSANGSTVVFLSAARCIKLHPPLPGYVESCRREVAALRMVHGRLPIATPEVLAEGAIESWRYFVSTRIAGRPIESLWESLDSETRRSLARRLGEAVRAMHGLRADPEALATDPWPEFRMRQRARCLDLERRKGLSAERRAEVERFLARHDGPARPTSRETLLHTEIGPSHVLVEGGRITGLIDFGDAMAGDPEYDLAPVGMFVTRGDSAAFRAFCLAYGLDAAELADPDRSARLLRHALLHRYGTLAWYLETLAPPAGSLDDLAAHWFGVG